MLPLTSFSKFSENILSNIELYKLYSDNKEFKEDFSAMMYGVVKEIIQSGVNAGV